MSNNKLTRQQKEAIGLLSIGTFLEYFDLMLYVHMAVLLNELFFPQGDPAVAKLLGATAFCLTYVLRPVGGFVIGWLGDQFGRKYTILLTTFIMAASCVTMATLKTYEQIGITATVIVIICRMAQGFSSMGESIGAKIYLIEILKMPHKYVCASIIGIFSNVGGLFALAVASFAISENFNFDWRYAFWIGAVIAAIGVLARTRLRESAEFADYKKRMDILAEGTPNFKERSFIEEKVDKKTILAFFLTQFITPACIYITYIYLGDFMKESLGMTSKEVINQNLKISILTIIGLITVTYLAKKYHPIKITLINTLLIVMLLALVPCCLYKLTISPSLFVLSCVQFVTFALTLSSFGLLESVCYRHFPISKRFTSVATTFGVANPIGYFMVSFGLIPLVNWFGYYGLLVMLTPVTIGYTWGVYYFRKLEIKNGRYHNYPHEDPPHEDTAVNEEDYNSDDLEDKYEPFTNKCEYSTNLMNKLDEFSKEKNVKLNMALIAKAITFAKKWHDGQMRKTGDHPFYWHPLKVAEMVAEHYCKTDMIVAAILHDVVEDSECTVELVKEKFSTRIAEMVDGVTKVRFENGKHVKLTLEQTLEKLIKIGDHEALFIKQMDRSHNLQTIEGLKPHKQQKMAEETSNTFIKLIAIIGDKLNIHGKMHLEDKMFKCCEGIIKKRKR